MIRDLEELTGGERKTHMPQQALEFTCLSGSLYLSQQGVAAWLRTGDGTGDRQDDGPAGLL